MSVAMSDEDDDAPATPGTLDDEMDDAMYEHPPGLMPSAEAEYDSVHANGIVTIYEKGSLQETRLKSDVYVAVIR